MKEINPSMRRLKRVPGENGLRFTLENATEQKKDNLLCNFCAWRDAVKGGSKCSKHSTFMRYQKNGIGLLVRTCEMYQPILTFRPTKKMAKGFQGNFNTFRLGDTWYNRVSPGVICGLYDANRNRLFGKAVVTATHNGNTEAMCYDHAYKNHLFIGEGQEEAANKMQDAMRSAYGHIMDHRKNDLCTVIDLQRIT